jgi:glycosyltransferase involved in cell wall biosynthesis
VSAPVAALIAEGPFILFLGRVNWKKGLDRLIAALTQAESVRVIIAGNDEDGCQSLLAALAERARVSDRVRFAGPVAGADKAALLDAARALVLPSYSENFGNVVLEAMAAARPVIVTPEVGVADLVRDAGAGLVVDGAPQPLGQALEKLFADTEAGRRMGERGRGIALQYSWDAVAAQMEGLYEEVAGERAR